MESWIINLISALGGAAMALIGKELIEYYRRPRFEIDFEGRAGQKPYIPDYNNEAMQTAGDVNRIKFLRLKVHNKGHKPAMDCEAKLELYVEKAEEEIHRVALHWSRRDPALYSEYGEGGVLMSINQEKVYTPISLNIHDKETADVFRLRYHISTIPDTNHGPHFSKNIESASFRQLQLQPETTYQCKVTVYSSNANPEAFNFKVNWDGTLEGFQKAFTKV